MITASNQWPNDSNDHSSPGITTEKPLNNQPLLAFQAIKSPLLTMKSTIVSTRCLTLLIHQESPLLILIHHYINLTFSQSRCQEQAMQTLLGLGISQLRLWSSLPLRPVTSKAPSGGSTEWRQRGDGGDGF